MVIKGYTRSSVVIDFNKVTIEFIESVKDKYTDLKHINTIDVLSYSCNEKDFEDPQIKKSFRNVYIKELYFFSFIHSNKNNSYLFRVIKWEKRFVLKPLFACVNSYRSSGL